MAAKITIPSDVQIREHAIYDATRAAFVAHDVDALMRALPHGQTGPGFPEGHDMLGHCYTVRRHISAFRGRMEDALKTLKDSGFSPADVTAWHKGVVAGFQAEIYELLHPMAVEAFLPVKLPPDQQG